MIVKSLKDIIGTDREVDDGKWVSRRLLLKDARMGFSLHDTIIRAGVELPMHYQNHLEAVYCVGGKGKLVSRDTGEEWPIEEGVVYTLDQHDRHTLISETEMRMVCVFNPPLTGRETHDATGAYPLILDDGAVSAPSPGAAGRAD